MQKTNRHALALGALVLALPSVGHAAQTIEDDAGIGADITLPNTEFDRNDGVDAQEEPFGVPANASGDTPGYDGMNRGDRLLSDGVDEGGIGVGGTPAFGTPEASGTNPFGSDDLGLSSDAPLISDDPIVD